MTFPSITPHGRALPGVLAVIVLVALGLALAGCTIELGLDTTVEVDGSGTVGIRMAADKEFQDLIAQQGGGGDLFAEFEQQMPEGWETQTGTDPDGTRWVTATTTFADLDEFESLLQEGGEGPAELFSGQQVTLTQESSLFATKTTFQAEWDAGSALASAGDELPQGVDTAMLSSIFQIQNRLTLPGSIGENNADEVDGNTLVWTPAMTGITSMSAESTAYKWGLIIGIIVAAVIALLAVIVVLIVLLRRKAPGPSTPALVGVPTGADVAVPPTVPMYGEQPAPAVEQAPGSPGETLWAEPPAPAEMAPAEATAEPGGPPAEAPPEGGASAAPSEAEPGERV